MYEVLRAYASHVRKGWVTVRFKDFDAVGNRHLLDISNGEDLELVLTASAFMIAEYRAGEFKLLCDDVDEKEMVERLKAAFEYLSSDPGCFGLWLIVRDHQEKAEVLIAQYSRS